MNVLVILNSVGNDSPFNYAVVPDTDFLLNGVTLDQIDRKDAQAYDEGEPIGDAIANLFDRFGLMNADEKEADLAYRLNPKPPFLVDKVITIHFTV